MLAELSKTGMKHAINALKEFAFSSMSEQQLLPSRRAATATDLPTLSCGERSALMVGGVFERLCWQDG
ncbi:MAG: hypothetical protein RMM98_02530 [Acidobacteriota bacterium]|nr:hypothetical protein [Blastocatellia bacterium]MDW8238466.1 hypothetical protein [Acidobacteriota bacterium]